MSRTLVIGDVHSYYTKLNKVISDADVDFTKDKVVFLGDYCDGGEHSGFVITYLTLLKKKYPDNVILLKGNHDSLAQDYFLAKQSGKKEAITKFGDKWDILGGSKSRKELDDYPILGRLVDFYSNLDLYHIDDQNRGFVHGGFASKKGLGYEAHETEYYWNRDLFLLAYAQKDGLIDTTLENANRFFKHKEVYVGHSPTTTFGSTKPITVQNVTNMDTGVKVGGELTIMDIDTKQIWQA